MTGQATDESWPMIEEAVFRLFDDLAATKRDEHTSIGPQLEDLGWSDIEGEYPIQACELLFRAEGRSLAQTDCLTKVMLAELAPLLDGPVEGLVLPGIADGYTPGSDGRGVNGILLGPLPGKGRLVVPVPAADGAVSIGIVDVDGLDGERLDTFDSSAHWTRVSGSMAVERVDAATEWHRAVVAAHRALATELIALADQALRIAVEQVSVRMQFGSPIGSFQSPRHLLADASAGLEGARALVDECWLSTTHSGVGSLPPAGGELTALTAKAAAGRAHRAVSDAAIQVCGAIGLTIEHDLHRYVTRGFQIDALCGSYQRLEALLADRLFTDYSPGEALPALVALG
ncbi:acyl-CoA dehydrogenase family protein [Mycolicibacterium sp. ELW1]|uniref:acyl-CoA dehydrogenase family protein n=2 Tax=Mycobacteriaceae TaxID=1762 RepID=UPI003D76E28A